MTPDVSVIVSTYNRCDSLLGTLRGLVNQDSQGLEYEVIVVDNNSTDQTRSVAQEFCNAHRDKMVYCFEPQQGVSYARNKGIGLARGSIIAITDDDIRPASNWVSSVRAGFDKFPDADCAGGKVLPEPHLDFPEWLTPENWSAMAFLDLGDETKLLDVLNGPGLVGANLAFRAAVLNEVGNFNPQLQRVKNTIGSMEDHEYQLRLGKAHKHIFYFPEMVVYANVFPERLTKTYHRRWHFGHGSFYALMKSPDFESSRLTFLDIPGHVYRRVFSNAYDCLKYRLSNKPALEFQSELEMRFFLGFIRKRLSERRGAKLS